MSSLALVGDVLGRYEIVGETGQGDIGAVYEAVDPTLGYRVALKVLRPELTASRKILEGFLAEARAAAVSHPNVVTLHEVGEFEGAHHLEDRHIEPIEHAAECRMTRRPVLTKVEAHRHPLTMPPRLLDDRRQASRALDYRRHCGLVHNGQRIGAAATTPVTGDRLQCFLETQHRHPLSNTSSTDAPDSPPHCIRCLLQTQDSGMTLGEAHTGGEE